MTRMHNLNWARADTRPPIGKKLLPLPAKTAIRPDELSTHRPAQTHWTQRWELS